MGERAEMNPYVIGGAALVLAIGGFSAGWRVNGWRHDSEALIIERAAAAAGQAATDGAVAAIGEIRIQNKTIRQELEREIVMQPVSAECDLSDGLFGTLNKAITGQVGGEAGVPRANPVAGQNPSDPHP